MCTLTWLRRPDGYELFFNRDEARTRLPARPPRIQRQRGVEFICPQDADAGGTWLGVNAMGLSVGLLNGSPSDWVPHEPRSRGLLVLELLDAGSSEEVAERVAAADLSRLRAFRLVALEPEAALLELSWDGRALAIEQLADQVQPMCSSSLDPLGATASRRARWAGLDSGEERSVAGHAAFHADHGPERGPLSTCMHRPDAETVSFTRTRVDGRRVQLGYSPGAPCLELPMTWTSLERHPSPAAGARAPRGA